MNVKHIFLASLLFGGCTASPRVPAADASGSARSYAASDARVRVMGRHLADGGAVSFGASGVTFFIRFRGTSLDVELERASADSANHDWFTVIVDGGEPSRFRTQARTTRYTLARGLPRGEHTVVLSKATEGQNGHDRLLAIHADELLQADPLPSRRIEYIGNSITAGYGADPRPVACKQGTWYDATHAWLAYGPRVARRVNAQWMLSAISGIGMVRNWNSPGPVMPSMYPGVYMDYTDSTTAWDFKRYTPDLVIVALGTNDFSDGAGPTPRPALDGDRFVRDYTQFVAGVRARYPNAKLLLLTSAMLDSAKNRTLAEYLQRVIDARATAGDTAISRFSFKGRYTSGCDGHPDLAEQIRMAEELEPEVRARMRW
jgi:hypothetical protein